MRSSEPGRLTRRVRVFTTGLTLGTLLMLTGAAPAQANGLHSAYCGHAKTWQVTHTGLYDHRWTGVHTDLSGTHPVEYRNRFTGRKHIDYHPACH